jgi:hypothetical protein
MDRCVLSDEQLIEKCEKWIDSLCKTGGKSWTLRVPVDFNNDPDMLFTELIERFRMIAKDKAAAGKPA